MIYARIDNEGYRPLRVVDIIDITKTSFPVFDTIPNELPRDTKLRWRTQYMDLATRQLDWVAHMLAAAYYGFMAVAIGDMPLEPVLQAMQDVLNKEADKFIANRQLYVCRFEVIRVHHDTRVCTEFHATVVLFGGHEPHKIHITPVQP